MSMYSLHEAVALGDQAKVKVLLKDNPEMVSNKDKNDLTPLHTAAVSGSKSVAKLLLSEGAYINAGNKDGH